MKTVTMLPMFLLAIHQMRYSEYLTTINQPIQQLLNTTKFSDVHLIVHDPYKNKSEVIDWIYKKVAEILPTTYIFLNNSIPEKLPSIYASHETLLLFIYFANNCPNLQRSKNIIDTITSNNNPAKVLLMTVLEEENCNFLSFLEQMWKNHILDVMILEVPKYKEDQTAIMIHQYNPFSKIYDRQPYTSSVEWFPNKLKNLYGYELKGSVLRTPNILKKMADSGGDIIIDGPEAEIWDEIVQVLNATPKLFLMTAKALSEFHVLMKNNDTDILMTLLSYFSDPNFASLDITLPLFFGKWCPVVPIFRQFKTFVTRAVIGIAINCSVILIAWRISVILKFDQKSWQLLKIFGILIDASVSMEPKRLIEKIMILGLIFVSAIGSSHLYANLTSNSFQEPSQRVYNDFEELNNSGLVPLIFSGVFNVTFVNDDSYFAALKKKAVLSNSLIYCTDLLVKYKNVTCFMQYKAAKKMIDSYSRSGENVMTICENLCYAITPVGYFMRKNSVYTDRINEILIRLQTSGLSEKLFTTQTKKYSLRKTHFINVDEQAESSLPFNLILIVGCGCLLSFLVFCAEIIINDIEKNKQK